MRNEFNKLKETLSNVVLFDEKVVIALNELEQKITEVEKRMECAIRSNKEVKEVTDKMFDVFHNKGEMRTVLHYANFEIIERGINDVDIALNLNDIEPIENNWYGLFEEPKKKEPKVLIPKGSIVVWDYSRQYYNAIRGAKAIVSEDYKEDDDYISVEWVDNERRNGQENGGYERDMFKEEFELPKEEVAPTELCKIPQTYEFVKDIIAKLKVIDVDGETMQYILEQVGMENQMLNQLITNSQL